MLDGVWLLAGGVAAASWLVVEGAAVAGALLAGLPVLMGGFAVAFWSVLDGVEVPGAVLWLEGAFWSVEVAALLGLADVPLIAVGLLPVQESEIMLTEVTCNDPPDCVPCTST